MRRGTDWLKQRSTFPCPDPMQAALSYINLALTRPRGIMSAMGQSWKSRLGISISAFGERGDIPRRFAAAFIGHSEGTPEKNHCWHLTFLVAKNQVAEVLMKKEDDDQKQFLKDLGATAEQTVQEVRGFEENYYTLVQGTIMALPWATDFNKKIRSYVEQNFAAAFAFARELSEADDLQDVLVIYGDYNRKCLQSITAQVRDFAETYMDLASSTIRAPSLMSPE